MTTHTIGTATVELFPEFQQGVVTIPITWEGEYERDLAAAHLFLAEAGMPDGAALYDMTDAGDEGIEVWVHDWSGVVAN